MGRKREWFKIEDAIKVLQCHKPACAVPGETEAERLPTNGNNLHVFIDAFLIASG
ncbi:hypothetical protein LEMLEM_LOCUS17120 [Lemmus lemmus]